MSTRPAPLRWARGFVLCAVLAPVGAAGHDLWIVAGQYRLAPGETTRVFINSGDDFPESLTLIGPHRVTRLALHGPEEILPIGDFRVEDESLSFEITPERAGSHVIALATRTRRVRIKAADFDDYLDESGLEAIASMRDELGESDRAAVERYAKWAKAFLDVGEPDSEEEEPAWMKPVGHPIEIVPGVNPNEVQAGESFTVQVLFEGEPLADVQVSGGKAGRPGREILTRTDAEGRAQITILSAGRWYLRAIHMVRLEDDPQIEWESFWSTATFEVR